MARAVGIDLGLMDIVSAVAGPDGPAVVTPSVVFLGREGGALAGDSALLAAETAPDRAVVGVRRLLDDPAARVDIAGAEETAADVVALVLEQVARDVEGVAGGIAGAAVAIPAWYHDGQRRAVRDALVAAGLPYRCLVNASTAAALAYAESRPLHGTVLVYRLGDGLLDVTVLDARSPREIELLSTDGHRGAFDEPIAAQVARSEAVVRRALRDAGVKPAGVTTSVLAGVAGGAPEAAALLTGLLGRPPRADVEPAEATARGAALRAAAVLAEQARAA